MGNNVKELEFLYDDIAPSISADGSEIALNTNKSGNFDIYSASVKKKVAILKALNSLNSEGDDIFFFGYDGQRFVIIQIH